MRFGLRTGDFAHCHRICPSSHNRGLDFITCRTRCVVPRPLPPQRGELRWLTRKRINTFGTIFKGSEKAQFRWCGPISRNHDATPQTVNASNPTGDRFLQISPKPDGCVQCISSVSSTHDIISSTVLFPAGPELLSISGRGKGPCSRISH